MKTGHREQRIERLDLSKKPGQQILLQAAKALESVYQKDAELTAFTDLDGDDFLVQG